MADGRTSLLPFSDAGEAWRADVLLFSDAPASDTEEEIFRFLAALYKSASTQASSVSLYVSLYVSIYVSVYAQGGGMHRGGQWVQGDGGGEREGRVCAHTRRC